MPAPTITLTNRSLAEVDADAVAVPLSPGTDGATVGRGGKELDLDLAAFLTRAKAKGEAGEVHLLPVVGEEPPHAVLLIGVGDGSPKALRKAGAALARRAKDYATVATTVAHGANATGLRAFTEGIALAAYSYSLKKEPKPVALREVTVVSRKPDQAAVDAGLRTARATVTARDLANTPSLEKTPTWLAKQASGIGRRPLTARIRDEKQLAAEGFGGILAVGAGSTRPPRLIELSYAPAGASRHVVLVGKGITFDSGGLSLKPSDGMVWMKTDMAGGAAVLGAMSAIAELAPAVRVTALVPAAENMPSGTATRPGDVITHYGGRTVEVLNTDAEGRLVLADALAYAVAELQPDVVIDLATLTGAMPVALGKRMAGLFCNDERLAKDLLAAADAAGERLWRMPLVEDYRFSLDSTIADLKNIGGPEVSGGSITAALFLREFVGDVPWAHLDIAGAARSDGDEDEVTRGATGYGVRTLLRYLEKL